jgi:2-C-methyl-D-erythritol 2,4-cyclodiphosphate synthase
MGDIGLHFPDSDHAFKDKPSSFFLRTVADLLRQRGKIIQNIDSVIIAQEPPLSPFFHRMRQIVAHTAGIDLTKVNLKAKSPEHVGSFGRGEAIAAYSVALLTETPGQKNCSAPQSQSPSPD